MSPEIEANALLKRSIDRKLCSGGNAESFFREAYEFAQQHKLYDPWLRIAAYRLGHCLFRKAKGETELIEVLRLFEEAAEDVDKVLTPKAKLYALAAKMRLGLVETDDFGKLVNSVRAGISEGSISRPHMRVIQGEIVNQLELLSYLGEFDYNAIEGLNPQIYDIDPFHSNWRIIGDPALDQILYAERHAIGKVRRLAVDDANSVVCIWNDEDSSYNCTGPEGSLDIPRTYSDILLTALNGDLQQLRSDSERTNKTRLNSDFKKLSGKSLFLPRSTLVNPELSCLAAVPSDQLQD